MIKLTLKCCYKGVTYSCYIYVYSIRSCASHNHILVCTKQSSISDTFEIAEFLSFTFLPENFVIVLKPYYYNTLVRIILDMGVYVFGATALCDKDGKEVLLLGK